MASREVNDRFIEELTRVLGATLETNASARPADAFPDSAFVVSLVSAGGDRGGFHARGALRVFFGRSAAEAVAKLSTGSAVEPSEASVLETLKEVSAQAATAFFDKHAAGSELAVVSAEVATRQPDPSTVTIVEMVLAGIEQVLHVAVAGDLDVVERAAQQPARQPSQTLDVILDMDLPLVVRFGRTEMPLKALTALGPGSIIDLGRAPEEPVDVIISNRVVARGEVVMVGGNYGVRIRDVISSTDPAPVWKGSLT